MLVVLFAFFFFLSFFISHSSIYYKMYLCVVAKMLSMSKGLGQLSYSGFFTVNDNFKSNMYFIFFPSQVSVYIF